MPHLYRTILLTCLWAAIIVSTVTLAAYAHIRLQSWSLSLQRRYRKNLSR